jgi:hypothetical protein
MKKKGKGAGSQGYPPGGLGRSPISIESGLHQNIEDFPKTEVHYRFLLTAQERGIMVGIDA